MPKKTTKKPSAKKNLKAKIGTTWKRVVTRTEKNPHHAFKMTRPRMIHITRSDIQAVWRLQTETWKFVWRFRRVLLGLGLLYAVIAYVLIGGVSQVNFVALKEATTQVIDGDLGALGTAVSMFGAALTGNLSSNTPSDVQQFLSGASLLLFWLALIWAVRMFMADKIVGVRDALYNSSGPIIPTLVVSMVAVVQLAPAALGIFVYASAISGGWLADGGVESMVFAAVAVLLTLLSLYFLVSSLTAMIIVSMPGTYPWEALVAARALVMNRRWAMVLRVVALVVHVVLLWAIVLIPVFLLDGWLRFDWLPLVPICVQALIGLTLVYTSVYIYRLYRSLLA
jgi:hypothetical protein